MTKKTLSGICSALVALVVAAGVCCAGYASRNDAGKWFKNGDISKWHWADKSPADNVGDNQGDEINNGKLVNEIESNGISLMSVLIDPEDYVGYDIDTQSDTAYTIHATVNEDAVDKSVIGGVKWKNASSWSSGKSIYDYVTLSQTTEYGLDFTFTIKQAFGDPVILTVASVMDSTVNATCQIDYLKPLESFTVNLNPSTAQGSGKLYVGNTNNVVQIVPVYGVGTVEGSISSLSLRGVLSSYTVSNLNSRLQQNSLTSGFTVKTNQIIFNAVQDGFNLTFDADKILNGTGDKAKANIILNNFIVDKGWTQSGTASTMAGFTSIRYVAHYTHGTDYDVTKEYYDNNFTGFRKDGLATMQTITNIGGLDDFVVYPE